MSPRSDLWHRPASRWAVPQITSFILFYRRRASAVGLVIYTAHNLNLWLKRFSTRLPVCYLHWSHWWACRWRICARLGENLRTASDRLHPIHCHQCDQRLSATYNHWSQIYAGRSNVAGSENYTYILLWMKNNNCTWAYCRIWSSLSILIHRSMAENPIYCQTDRQTITII